MSHLLGQHLSERWFDKGSPDPLGRRVWVALRYLTVVISVTVVAVLFDRSPGGAFLTGVGGCLAVSGLLNVVGLPRDERSPRTDLLLLGAGSAAAAVGVYLLVTAS